MPALSIGSMRDYLGKSISSMNQNKLNGLLTGGSLHSSVLRFLLHGYQEAAVQICKAGVVLL